MERPHTDGGGRKEQYGEMKEAAVTFLHLFILSLSVQTHLHHLVGGGGAREEKKEVAGEKDNLGKEKKAGEPAEQGQRSAGQRSAGQRSAGQRSAGQRSAGQRSAGVCVCVCECV